MVTLTVPKSDTQPYTDTNATTAGIGAFISLHDPRKVLVVYRAQESPRGKRNAGGYCPVVL